jgi:hypothetical protein
VEVLLGVAIKQRGFGPEAARTIAAGPEERFEYVLDAARTYVAASSGWW